MNLQLSIVIPAFNEATTLPAHCARLVQVLTSVVGDSWEIIVVDDGSTDDTRGVVMALTELYPLRLICCSRNGGKGHALRQGVQQAVGAAILTCDADMATDPQALPAFLEALHAGADIVIGNRRDMRSMIMVRQSWPRRYLGRCYQILAQQISGLKIRDFNCGFKLFRGDVARNLFARTIASGWVIDIEVLSLAAKERCRIVSLPVTWSCGRKSSVRIPSAIVSTLGELTKIRFRGNSFRKFFTVE